MYVSVRTILLRGTFIISYLLLSNLYFLKAIKKSVILVLLPSNGLGGFPWRLPFELIVIAGGAGVMFTCTVWILTGGMTTGFVVPCEGSLVIPVRYGGAWTAYELKGSGCVRGWYARCHGSVIGQ